MSAVTTHGEPPRPAVRGAFQQALWEAEEQTLGELRVVREALRCATASTAWARSA
jgi:hypothetical protein